MKTLLKTHNLTLQVAHKTICKHLSLQVEPGDVWGLLGSNGSGKTTLLNTLAGLRSTTQGEVHLQDKPLNTFSRKDIAKQIGILFQDTQFLFPQSVYEFCYDSRHPHTSLKTENEIIVANALAAMELDKMIKQNIQTLSGGEKRRLAIAALLAQTPSIYLLDEPTNHLDLRYQLHAMRHFKNVAANNSCGVMMAIHDLHLARQFCNKVLMIFEDGETLQGLTNELMTDEIIGRLYRLI